MERRTLRDRVHRFDAEGPDGLMDRAPALPRVPSGGGSDDELVTGPDPDVDGVARWRRIDPKRIIEERFGLACNERAISNLLDRLAFSRINGRPQRLEQDAPELNPVETVWRYPGPHLPLEPGLQDLPRDPRYQMRCPEQAQSRAPDHNIHRHA